MYTLFTPAKPDHWAMEPEYPTLSAADVLAQDRLHAQLAARGPFIAEVDGVLVGVDSSLPRETAWRIVSGVHAQHGVALARKYVMPGDRAVCVGAWLGVVACAVAQQSGARVTCIDQNPGAADRIQLAAELNEVLLSVVHGKVSEGSADDDMPVVDLARTCLAVQANTVYLDLGGDEQTFFKKGVLPSNVTKLFVELHRPAYGGRAYALVLNDIYALGFRMGDCSGLAHVFVR